MDAVSIDHLARDHLEVAPLLAVPAAHVAAVEPDHDGSGHPRRGSLLGRGRVRPHDRLTDAPRPVPDRAGVPHPGDREQLGQERGGLAEGDQRRVPGRDIGELGRDGATAEVEDGEALRLARAVAGAG
jgi:hypothetical protein